MPLYDYECRGCGHRFEALVRPSSPPACPSCQGQDLEQLLSLFAVSSDGTRRSNLQAAKKKNSKVLREKQMAQLEYEKAHQRGCTHPSDVGPDPGPRPGESPGLRALGCAGS